MTKYEKAINGKQQDNALLDEFYTYDLPQPEPMLSQNTYEYMKYIEDQDNTQDLRSRSSKERVCHNSPIRREDVSSGAIENLDKPILVNNKKGVKANKRKRQRRPETNKI